MKTEHWIAIAAGAVVGYALIHWMKRRAAAPAPAPAADPYGFDQPIDDWLDGLVGF